MILEILQVGPLAVNCYILGCEESREGVIIDAGGDAAKILDRVAGLRLSVRYLLNTHGHFDHVGGNAAVLAATSARYLIHRRDEDYLNKAADSAARFGVRAENSPLPHDHLEDNAGITFGRYELTVLHTPGHTPGGCSLYCAAEGVLFTGDTLFAGSVGRTDLPGGSTAVLTASIQDRLYTLPASTRVYPGHGPSTTIGQERQFNPYVRPKKDA